MLSRVEHEKSFITLGLFLKNSTCAKMPSLPVSVWLMIAVTYVMNIST